MRVRVTWYALTKCGPGQTRIELEQGNYPKPPAWLVGGAAGDTAGAPPAAPQLAFDTGSFQPGGMNPYAGDFNGLDPEMQAMLERMNMQSMSAPVAQQNESAAQPAMAAMNQEAWMQEQDRLLESIVAAATGGRPR